MLCQMLTLPGGISCECLVAPLTPNSLELCVSGISRFILEMPVDVGNLWAAASIHFEDELTGIGREMTIGKVV